MEAPKEMKAFLISSTLSNFPKIQQIFQEKNKNLLMIVSIKSKKANSSGKEGTSPKLKPKQVPI